MSGGHAPLCRAAETQVQGGLEEITVNRFLQKDIIKKWTISDWMRVFLLYLKTIVGLHMFQHWPVSNVPVMVLLM